MRLLSYEYKRGQKTYLQFILECECFTTKLPFQRRTTNLAQRKQTSHVFLHKGTCNADIIVHRLKNVLFSHIVKVEIKL